MTSSFGKMLGAYFLLAILVAALPACAKTGEPELATSSGGEAAPAEPAKPLSSSMSPADALAQAMRAQLAAKSYRVRISVDSPSITGESFIEYVAPDSIHITSPGSEIITVGSEAYARQGQGPWQKAPSAGEITKMARDPKRIDQMTTNNDIKYVGQETLDGAPMLVYEYTPKDTSPEPKGSKTKVWVGAEDSLPRKMVTEDPTTFTVTTRVFSDYNSNIKIELPT